MDNIAIPQQAATPPPSDILQQGTGIESMNDIERTLPSTQDGQEAKDIVSNQKASSINVVQHQHQLVENLVDRRKASMTESSNELIKPEVANTHADGEHEQSSDEASDDTSESDSDSGAEEDSDLEANDADDDAQEHSDEEAVEVTDLKAFAKQLMEEYGQDDADWDEDGGGAESGPPRTFNEMLSQPLDIPAHDLAHVEITELGVVQFVMPGDASLTVMAKHDARRGVLNIGSAVCLEDKTLIRPITDVFGNVQDPHYELTFASLDEINSFGLKPGVKLFFPEHDTLRQFALADELRRNKGTDASGEHDEEPDEMYFSDDEKEQEYNRMKKAAVKGRKNPTKQQSHPSHSKPYLPKSVSGPPRPPHMATGGGRGDHMVSQVDTPSLDYGDSPAAARPGADGYNVLRRPENYGSREWNQPPKTAQPPVTATFAQSSTSPPQSATYPQQSTYPQQHTYQQPVYQQPAYQQPTYQQPPYQQPSYQQPPPQQQQYQQPIYQQQTYQASTYQQPNYPAYPQPLFLQAGQHPINGAYAPQVPPPPSLQDAAFLAFAQNQMGHGAGRGGQDRGRGRGH